MFSRGTGEQSATREGLSAYDDVNGDCLPLAEVGVPNFLRSLGFSDVGDGAYDNEHDRNSCVPSGLESLSRKLEIFTIEENHAKEKQKARAQLEMALASIQTELEFFDWEDRWVRKLRGMAHNVLNKMSEMGEVAQEHLLDC